MGVGHDEELRPFQETPEDLSDVERIGNEKEEMSVSHLVCVACFFTSLFEYYCMLLQGCP